MQKGLDELIKDYIYKYQTAQYKDLLKHFKGDFSEGQIAGKLNLMTKKGELVRVKRGVYGLSATSSDLYNTLKSDIRNLLKRYDNIPLANLKSDDGKKFMILYEKIQEEVRK